MKCIRDTQHIIRLVNINIVGILVHGITRLLLFLKYTIRSSRCVLVHEIDIIIYAYEIDQIHVIFYLVSTFKLHSYEYT